MSAIFFISLLFSAEFYNVTPTGRWILAFEIVLDGIGEDIRFALPVFSCVLLGTDDDGL